MAAGGPFRSRGGSAAPPPPPPPGGEALSGSGAGHAAVPAEGQSRRISFGLIRRKQTSKQSNEGGSVGPTSLRHGHELEKLEELCERPGKKGHRTIALSTLRAMTSADSDVKGYLMESLQTCA